MFTENHFNSVNTEEYKSKPRIFTRVVLEMIKEIPESETGFIDELSNLIHNPLGVYSAPEMVVPYPWEELGHIQNLSFNVSFLQL